MRFKCHSYVLKNRLYKRDSVFIDVPKAGDQSLSDNGEAYTSTPAYRVESTRMAVDGSTVSSGSSYFRALNSPCLSFLPRQPHAKPFQAPLQPKLPIFGPPKAPCTVILRIFACLSFTPCVQNRVPAHRLQEGKDGRGGGGVQGLAGAIRIGLSSGKG